MNLTEVSWTDVRDAEPDVALCPVGSTEQHGPHAPLGTDALNAVAVAEAADDRLAGDEDAPTAVVAPPVHVGVAEEHRAFDGTLWVSPDTFRAYVRETLESLAFHGIDRAVLVNGHGGNVAALAEVARRVSRRAGTDASAVSAGETVSGEST
ncbi:MAG: creatininase family protein, partial [Halobaculum sp.]